MSLGVPELLLLDVGFLGKLRLLRTLHTPAALLGAEASVVSHDALRKLRTAFVRAVWSESLNLANPGVVLYLLDGPVGCDPGYHVAWCRFRMFRGHMACKSEVHGLNRIYCLLRLCGCAWSWSHSSSAF